MINFAHKYDLFSQPFSFKIGEKRKKSTTFGGLLSLSILTVSLAYLSYLLFNFFSYKIYPSVSNSIKINERVEIDLDYNFHMFQVLINGIPLEQYEAQQNKKYITQKLIFEQNTGAEYIKKEINFNDCQQPGFPNFNCMSSEEQSNTSYMISTTREQGFYTLLIGKCVNEVGVQDNCATEQEIDDLLTNINSYFSLYVQIKQYNTLERKYEMGFKQEIFYIDTTQVTYSTITLKKAISQVTQGLIIQQTDQVKTVFDYHRFDSIYLKNRDPLYDEPGFKMVVGMSFQIDQISNNVVIQHVQLTQILAQFMSLFNSLLVIGIFARFIASKNIHKDIRAILFANSYKQQAYDIIKYSQLNHCIQTEITLNQKPIKLTKNEIEQSKNVQNIGIKKIISKNESVLCEKQIERSKDQASIIETNNNQAPVEKGQQQGSLQNYQSQTKILNKPQTAIAINQLQSSINIKQNQSPIQLNQIHQSQQASLNQQSLLKLNQIQISLEKNNLTSPLQKLNKNNSAEDDNSNLFKKICHKENQIQKNKYSLQNKSTINIPLSQKIKQLVCRIFFCRRNEMKQENDNEKQQLKYVQDIFGKIDEEVRNTLNIYCIYQDLIKIKMAIKLLFTKDQYAALHYCTNSIINDSDFQKKDITSLKINQEIEQIIKEENNIQPDLFNSNFPIFQEQEQEEGEVLTNQNLAKFKQKSVIVDGKSNQSHFTKNYFNLQQTNQQKRFIEYYNNQITNTQNDQNQDIQNILNCQIIGDIEGNIQNESLDKDIMNGDIDFIDAKVQIISKCKDNTFDFNSMKSEYTKHPQVNQKNGLKIILNEQQPQNEQKDNLYNHLQVMELIDKDIQIREIYLNKFIERHIQSQNNNTLTITDANIFNSLLK